MGLSLLFVGIGAYGQNKQVTLSASAMTVEQMLRSIEKQTSYLFVYNASEIDAKRKVQVKAKKTPVSDVLRQIFRNTKVTWQQDKTNIRLFVREALTGGSKTGRSGDNNKSMKKVKGHVHDAAGEPIIGASVFVKGTSKGAITDVDGNFSIDTPQDATLQINYIGFQNITVPTAHKSGTIDVEMVENVKTMNDVIVIGYGTARKRDVSTAVSTVSVADLGTRPVTEAGGFIQGKVAGVAVQQTSGAPDGTMTVRVRGASSISSSNDPLYVVDGVPVGEGGYAISYLSPGDIESMQVLKDASSAAIYGSRAANGVVLITTKQGKKGGKPQVSLRTYWSFNNVKRTYKVLNHEQYKELLMDEGNQAMVESMPFELTDNTDWFDETYRTGLQQNYEVSVQNATQNSRYYVSAAYLNNKGVINTTYNRRYNVRANIQNDLFSWLSLDVNMAYTNEKSNNVNTGLGANRGDVVLTALCTPTYATIWDSTTPTQYFTSFYGLSGLSSPVENFMRTANNYVSYDRLIATGSATVKFCKALTFKSSVTMDRRWTHTSQFLDPLLTIYGRQNHGRAYDGRADDKRMVFDNILTYHNVWGKHNFEIMGGTSATQSNYQGLHAGTTYLMTDHIDPDMGLAAGNRPYTYGNDWTQWTIMSYLGRVSYNWSSRYYLTANFRADGSSKFAPGHKWGFFPSVSAAWRMSDEAWLRNVKWLSDLKFRFGWGRLGNQTGLSDYAWVQKYNLNYYDYTRTEYATAVPTIGGMSVMGNKDLTWETTSQLNAGIDLSLFNSRLNFTFDAYYKYTTHLLINVPLPSTAKVNSLYRNEGEMSNWGLEMAVQSVNIDHKDFHWSTDFNISMNRNKLKKLSLQKVYNFAATSDESGKEYVVRMAEGKPLSCFYGYVSKGVDPQTGNIVYADLDGNGKINANDKTYIGDANPDFQFGMNNTIRWKNLSLSFLITGSVGNDIFNASKVVLVGMNNGYNQITETLKRWRQPGDITSMPRAGGSDNLKVSSRWVEDGSYLKVKNITLSYDLKSSWLKHLYVKRITPYVTLNNWITLTHYSGYDPEVSQYSSATEMGIDWGTYPNTRSVVFGCNIDI